MNITERIADFLSPCWAEAAQEWRKIDGVNVQAYAAAPGGIFQLIHEDWYILVEFRGLIREVHIQRPFQVEKRTAFHDFGNEFEQKAIDYVNEFLGYVQNEDLRRKAKEIEVAANFLRGLNPLKAYELSDEDIDALTAAVNRLRQDGDTA